MLVLVGGEKLDTHAVALAQGSAQMLNELTFIAISYLITSSVNYCECLLIKTLVVKISCEVDKKICAL